MPDVRLVGSLDPDGDADGTWRSPLPKASGSGYRLCQNDKNERVCNWAIPADDDGPFCVSCRTTRVIPNLADASGRSAWYRLEVAKRRLLFTLIELGMPLRNRVDDPERGLTFDFLADADPGGAPVLTGHADGVITVNIAEADDAERERRRAAMLEPYRTLLGHMRHESGHYYWDADHRRHAGAGRVPHRCSETSAPITPHRLRRTTRRAPQPTGRNASSARMRRSHPWEDWAETWAQYLHMVDTLETAAACGLSLKPRRRDEPTAVKMPQPVAPQPAAFEELIDSWFPLTYV